MQKLQTEHRKYTFQTGRQNLKANSTFNWIQDWGWTKHMWLLLPQNVPEWSDTYWVGGERPALPQSSHYWLNTVELDLLIQSPERQTSTREFKNDIYVRSVCQGLTHGEWNIPVLLAQTQWKKLSPHVGVSPFHWEGPSGSRRPPPGLGCTVSLPQNPSFLHGKLKGTTSPLEPCVPEAPAGLQY